MLASSDFTNNQADAFVALGEVFSLAGRAAEGKSATDEAIRLFEAKGSLAGLSHLRGLALEAGAA
jgi:hypothetical protein